MQVKVVKNLFLNFSKTITGRLANKLILTFSLTVSIFITALIFLSYSSTANILKNDFIVNNNNILKFANKNFETYLSQIDELSLLPRKDQRFMDALMTQSDDFSSRTYVQDMIKNLFYSRVDIEELKFYIPADSLLFSISHTKPNMDNEKNGNIPQTDWYKNASKSRYFRYVEPGLSGKVFFTFHRALINFSNSKVIGLISISFNFKGMDKLVEDASGNEGELFGIFDSQNTPFFSNDPELLLLNDRVNFLSKIDSNASNGNFEISSEGTRFLVIYNISDNSKWKMVKLIPLDIVNQKAQQTRNLSFLLGLIFIVLLIIIITFISSAITGSLRKLTKQMDKVGSGNFEVKAEIRGNDEIARLSKKFNSMVVQINDLVNEEYRAKISEKNARLKALEAQINPHFLYNSLQAIATKAVISGMKDISKMVEALAYALRYCIKGGDMVKVSNEIEHIRNYLILHKARFEDRLSVEIGIEEGIDNVLIPKLSIQTMVENSIKHALEQMTEAILIRIETYTEKDKLIIKVTDNGPGMSSERLEQVMREINDINWMEKSNESIGLKNLNLRLKLIFGNEAGLVIKSSLNRGTEVEMILPIGNQGGDAVVQGTDH